MPNYESPDATVALMRAALIPRHLQAGDGPIYPSLPPSSPFVTPTPKEKRRQQPSTRDPHFKNIGEGAFMKDMVFQRKQDGAIFATPKNTDVEQMGRTIYAPKARMQSTQHRSARNAARRRRQLPTKPSECATLRRLASIDAKELSAQVKKTPKWAASLQDNMEELTWDGNKVRTCGAVGLWSPLLPSDDSCLSPASRTASTPGLTTASSPNSESEPAFDFRATDLEGLLEQEVTTTKVDRMFDMFIDVAACTI